jgi:uncharacterized protein (DUF1499 family)
MKLTRSLALSLLLQSLRASAFSPCNTNTSSNHERLSKVSCSAHQSQSSAGDGDGDINTRRDWLKGTASLILGTTAMVLPQESMAFDNKISNKYDDRPKRKGPQPKDLGVATRKDMVGEEYKGLKNCGAAPNCFCSTDDIQDDPEHNIPAWTIPEGSTVEQAFIQLEQAVQAYKPGQGNIDGGGFKIIKSDPAKGYLYAQFEALKAGYIDDLEFAYVDGLGDNAVQVRSSSRVGYLDFGVNAKRVNYIAKGLREKGWKAAGVDFSTHQDYAVQNQVS